MGAQIQVSGDRAEKGEDGLHGSELDLELGPYDAITISYTVPACGRAPVGVRFGKVGQAILQLLSIISFHSAVLLPTTSHVM